MAGLHAEVAQEGIAAQPGIDETILSAQAVVFLHALHCRFRARRQDLLTERLWRQRQFDRGHFPEFLPGKGPGHDPEWTVAPIPQALVEQKVMVTGAPWGDAVSRGLKSGASAFVADFDDCSSPVWTNCLKEHANLRETNERLLASPGRRRPAPRRDRRSFFFDRAIGSSRRSISRSMGRLSPRRSLTSACISFTTPRRSWRAEVRPASLCLNLKATWKPGCGMTSLPSPRSTLGIPHGSIRAIITIETLSAAFEMEEILFELRDYAFALGCSPSNYLAATSRLCERTASICFRNAMTSPWNNPSSCLPGIVGPHLP